MLLEYYVVWTLKEEKMHTARSRFAKYSKAVHSASFHEYFDFWLHEKKTTYVRDGKFEENHLEFILKNEHSDFWILKDDNKSSPFFLT